MAEQDIIAARYTAVTVINCRIPGKAIWVELDITMAVIGTYIGTMAIMVISAADISIPVGGTGTVVIAADIITVDEKNSSELRRGFATIRV
jgi:hypothetical protein